MKELHFMSLSAALAAFLICDPIMAQETAPTVSGGLDEIIVTARKREESILNVPVDVNVVSGPQLQKMQIIEMTDLPNVVPGLLFGRDELAIGTLASIRGIGTSASEQGIDQSVALNIDGMLPGTGLAYETALFDLQSIEVLKGPQALFFGKSTPGGVISIRSADPTDQFEVIGRESFDFEAQTPREEFIISGPVTDTLKLRLASYYSTSQGYFENKGVAVPDTGAVTPTDRTDPASTNYFVRGTALWDPTTNFSVRLKGNWADDRSIDQELSEYTDCPQGAAFAPIGIHFIGTESGDCHLGKNLYTVWMNPAAYPGFGPLLNNGVPFVENRQAYGTLELNYRPADALTVTSVTAYYKINSTSMVNSIETSGAGSPIATEDYFKRTEATEELRLNSDFASPLNFTVGGFYEDGKIDYSTFNPFNVTEGLPASGQGYNNTVNIKTYSAFGQLRYKILPELEFAGGARWSDETRNETPLQLDGSYIAVAQPRVHANNTSPEATLTYRPTSDMTVYAAYKQAFKSGSFSISSPVVPGQNNAFGEEKVRGQEIGFKSRLLDHQLSFNATIYDYDYSGLQVSGIIPNTNGMLSQATTVNAGSARTWGVDLDSAYRPNFVEGLTLNGSASWNRARYLVLNNVPCWAGQTIALGCNQLYSAATGLYNAQSLSGSPLIRAPEWQLQAGINYEFPAFQNYRMSVGASTNFDSRFVTVLAVNRPNNDNFQGSFAKTDLNLSLKSPDGRWEISLVGKNVTNRITSSFCNIADFATGAFLGPTRTGAATSGPDGLGQENCDVDPPREAWLRLTFKPFGPSE